MTAYPGRDDTDTMRHGGARTLGLDPHTLDFSTSINPLGMPEAVARMLSGAANLAVDYPDEHARMLECAAAAYAGISADMVVAGNGATELIHNICRDMPGRRVLVPAPGFGEYAAAARLCGSPVSEYEGGVPAHMPRNGCVFVCNPSNPTGMLTGRDTILEAASEAARTDSMLVVDECFIEMTPGRDESVVPYAGQHENMVVLRSLTKSFGLAGLRVGYGIADPDISARLRNIRMPWSVNALAQAAGIESLSHPEHLEAARHIIHQETDRLYTAMLDMDGLKPQHTDTNYMVAGTADPAPVVVERLLEQNILVRDCSSFGMDHHIRISAKTPDKNKILLDALRNVCRA